MTVTLAEVVNAVNATFPDRFDGLVEFDVAGAGTLLLDGNGARPSTSAVAVNLRFDPETFTQILRGTRVPVSLYLAGRLQITGDLALARRLSSKLR